MSRRGSDGRSIILRDFDLLGDGELIIVRLETGGDLAGTFYLTDKPLFNTETNRFSVEEVDFDDKPTHRCKIGE